MSNSEDPRPGTSRSAWKRPRDETEYIENSSIIKEEPDGSDSPSLLDHGNVEDINPCIDVKPIVNVPMETESKNDVPKFSLPEGNDPRQPPTLAPIVNFFGFNNPNVVQPKVSGLNYSARDVGAPPPKMPKKAHYNCHDAEEETKYVAENAPQQEKAIPGHKADSDDSEDDSAFEFHRERYFKKQTVYAQFDFKKRKIDTSRLVACTRKDMILKAIEENRVVIVEGFTGCGKTTQVPQFILDQYAAANRPCNIIVTQPRRIAAVSVAKRVCFERGWDVGSVVGYQVGMERRTDKNTTILTYVTTGVLLQKLIGSRTVKDFTHIIIDEVHERDLESDLLLLVIKKILQDDDKGRENHVKLILMSATLNAQKFSAYFVSQCNDSDDVVQSPVVKIPTTFRHRIEEFFLDSLVKEDLLTKDKLDHIDQNLDREKAVMLEEAYDVAVNLIVSFDEVELRASAYAADPRRHRQLVLNCVKKLIGKLDAYEWFTNYSTKAKMFFEPDKRGSVLIFLPGMEEINLLFKLLTAKNKERMSETREPDEYKWDICPLHSSVTNEDQARVFETPHKGRRKIILSTNIAESSVTVPDVVYVIDFCMTKSMCVDPRTNFTTLRLVWASISQCIQRKGRTGRVADGRVYRLVSKRFFALLDQDTKPEMLRSNLETVILQLKKFNLGSPKQLLSLALDPPDVSGIERAVANLKEYGALTINVTDPKTNTSKYDTCDGDCTFLGKIMTELPIPQQCSRLLMLGHCFGVLKESIIIAAALSVKNPFSTPFQKELAAYLTKMNWSKKSYSDCFCLLHIYKHWIAKFADTGDGQLQVRARDNERRWARGEYVQLPVLREIKSTVELIEERLKHRLHIIPQPLVEDKMDGNLTKEQSLMLKIAIAGAFYPNYFHRHRPDMKSYEKECSKEVSGHDLFNTVVMKGFPPKHNGKLYAKHIADYLAFGLTIPVIKFEGQKVIALFDNRGDKIGPINKGLYRAIKKRQIRDYCEFDMVWEDKETEELRNWQRNQDRRQFTKAPKQVELPPITAREVLVFITHMLTPSHFWVVYMARYEYLLKMTGDINRELCHIPLLKRKIIPNGFCLAPHNDRMYYRGKILVVDPAGEALIYFVDYGNSAWTRTSVLCDFSPSMTEKGYDTYPALAVECRLAQIKPATVHGPVWHEDAVKQFHRFTNDIGVMLQIYSVFQSVIVGRLKGKSSDDADGEYNFSINEYLLKEGFGDFMPESYLSELNHNIRNRAGSIKGNIPEYEAHNKDQIAENYDLDFIEPPQRGTIHVSLKGPWSPLELEFQNLCCSSSSKQVTIDNHSVNSVVLDFEPTAPTSRLLVAAHVAIQDRSGRLVARDTTIMPALPGLIALMSMMFAPKIELRTDMRRTRYTGVLCGLGTSPTEPDLPIYPDHDLEIVFDTEIDDEDVEKINRIRYMMNLILRQDGGKVNIAHFHKGLVKEIFLLLKRERKRAEEEIWPQEEYVWNKLDPDSLKTINRQTFDYRHLDIFLPHRMVNLNIEHDDDMSWGFDV